MERDAPCFLAKRGDIYISFNQVSLFKKKEVEEEEGGGIFEIPQSTRKRAAGDEMPMANRYDQTTSIRTQK